MAKLYFYYSTMNAGKSSLLLQSSYNYQERGMRTMLFTAAIDTRSGAGRISSRIGIGAEAFAFGQETDFLTVDGVRDADCIFVDEAQFLTQYQVQQLTDVVDELGIPACCYGLRTDFRGHLFEGSHWLLACADEIQEVKAICTCGRKATMVVRVAADGRVMKGGPQIEIGGNDRYVALCRRCAKDARSTGHLSAGGVTTE